MYKNYKFKISAPTWNDRLELPNGSNSVSDIHDYFEYIIKKHETLSDNPPIKLYVNKKKSYPKLREGIILNFYHLKIKNKVTKNKNGENMPHLEIPEVVLVHFNIVNNDYEHDLRVLYTFVTNKSLGQLLDISLKIKKKLEFRVWFTDQNSKPLEIEDKITITLTLIEYTIQLNLEI